MLDLIYDSACFSMESIILSVPPPSSLSLPLPIVLFCLTFHIWLFSSAFKFKLSCMCLELGMVTSFWKGISALG